MNDLQFIVLTKIGNRYRVFSNHSRAGKVYVQEGKYVKDAIPAFMATTRRGKPSAMIDPW